MSVDDQPLRFRAPRAQAAGSAERDRSGLTAPPALRLSTPTEDGPASRSTPPRRRLGRRRGPRPPRPRVRKLRLLVILGGLVTIAGIAAVFGMLAAVASDLPQLSNAFQFRTVDSGHARSVDSFLYDASGTPIGVLAPPNQPVIDTWDQISQNMVHAIVSVEDKHFWTEPGINFRSIGRALLSDLSGGPTQGASTIPEEFVKNAEAEQNHRTIFEKLREAALAFQLVHRWKRTKILTQYLNIIYFGNGAYGIEAAARIYFGKQLGYDPANPDGGRCGTPTAARPRLPACASLLDPAQAALLAAMVANPYEFDPILHPVAATGRRNDVVLADMVAQHYLSRDAAATARTEPLPRLSDIQQPTEPPAAPYFTSWVRPQIVAALERSGVSPEQAQYEAYYGGLKIRLTIDLKLQQAAQQAIDAEFPAGSGGPTAALVSIDNASGEVRAMVSGNGDFQHSPFNLATLGYRQPGSAFKVFTLVRALESGDYGPGSIIDSQPLDVRFRGPAGELEQFPVHNDNNAYSGPISLATATAISDNSVFVQVGMHLGTPAIAHEAHLLGIRSSLSTNPAMIIGGLNHGVSVLDLTHAYETLATGGEKVTNPVLGDRNGGPVGIHSIIGCAACNESNLINHPHRRQVVPAGVAAEVHQLLAGVVSSGTGTLAAIPGVEVVGKTGTTSGYVDAWFCGWTSALTTCVWVGYPDGGRSMSTNWNGGPVLGGTFPALIWHNYTTSALSILATEATMTGGTTTLTTPVSTLPLTGPTSGVGPVATGTVTGAGTGTAPLTSSAPTTPAPTSSTPTPAPVNTVPAAPAPTVATGPAGTGPPATGGGTGTSGGAGIG